MRNVKQYSRLFNAKGCTFKLEYGHYDFKRWIGPELTDDFSHIRVTIVKNINGRLPYVDSVVNRSREGTLMSLLMSIRSGLKQLYLISEVEDE